MFLGILRVISGWIFNAPKSLIEIDKCQLHCILIR